MSIHPLAGRPAPLDALCNIPQLLVAYYSNRPDPNTTSERVSFGTSGHRGVSSKNSFNEDHIAAVSQAVCDYRERQAIEGPLFLGADSHALSEAALVTAIEVLAANRVELRYSGGFEYTPTPVVSNAILRHNRGQGTRHHAQADGIIITPSHNPPDNGGFKYNPPTGGPADTATTRWIEDRANLYLERQLQGVKRVGLRQALAQSSSQAIDYKDAYIEGLASVVDMSAIAASGLHIGVDPLGGAGLPYWEPLAEHYKLNIEVVNKDADPRFAFMTLDKDGVIRMDCSSPYAMASLIALKDRFDIAFGNDPDYDRHGIVTKSLGLLNPNHYLAVAISYLFENRRAWPSDAAVGKTLVSSALIDRVARKLGRPLAEVPVGFKWFVDGLLDGSYGFGGEESAGASFLAMDGGAWSTDKDGFIMDLLAAEILAKTGKDPGEHYQDLVQELGEPVYARSDAAATRAQKEALQNLDASAVKSKELAGERIEHILTKAPANDAPIGGLKVITQNGWFAARPSGTEDLYKIYAESFKGLGHLEQIQEEARDLVGQVVS